VSENGSFKGCRFQAMSPIKTIVALLPAQLAAGCLGWLMIGSSPFAATWLINSLLAWALVVLPPTFWGVPIAAAVFFPRLVAAFIGSSWPHLSLYQGVGIAESLLIALILRRWDLFEVRFEKAVSLFKLISAVVVVAAISATPVFFSAEFGEVAWRDWCMCWLGDATGIVLLLGLCRPWESGQKLLAASQARVMEWLAWGLLLSCLPPILGSTEPQSVSALWQLLALPLLLWGVVRVPGRVFCSGLLIGVMSCVLWLPGNPATQLETGMLLCAVTALALLLKSAWHERGELQLLSTEAGWVRQHLLSAMKAGTWSRNIRTNEVVLSPEWKSMLGFAEEEVADSPEEFIGRLDPDDVARVQEFARRYVTERPDEPYENQFRLRHRDGSYRWILSRAVLEPDKHGELNLFKGIAIDITRVKAVEQALREAEERYRHMVDDQLELVVRWTPDTRLTYVNETAHRFLGGRLGNPIGRSFFELLGIEYQARLETWTHQRPLDPKDLEGVTEAVLINAQGAAVWTQWTNRPILDESGRVVEVQSVGRDITARKRLEEDLQDRLDFEALLAKLARGFLEAPPEQFSQLMDQSLAAVGKQFDADRIGIYEFTENLEFSEFTHEYCAPGIAPLLGTSPFRGQRSTRADKHGIWQRFIRGDRLIFRSPGELAGDPAMQQAYAEHPVKSLMQVPLKSGSRVVGFLFQDSVHRERDWSEREILQFEIVASLLSAAIWRHRVEQDVQFRADLDRLVAKSSNRFLNCSVEEIDFVVQSTLADLGEITGADRCYCFEFSDNLNYARERHEWCRPGVPSNMHQMLAMPTSPFQWTLNRLLQGEVIHIANVESLPPEASNLRSQMKGSSTVSSVIAPIFVQGRLDGFIGLSSVTRAFDWPQDRVGLIGVVAEMIAAARERILLATSLEERRKELLAASRLAVLGELVAGIAHEVKQPLHAIRNFASAIGHAADNASPGDLRQIHEWSARTQTLVDRTNAIITRFRNFSRLPQPAATRRKVSIGSILDDAVELVAGELTRHSIEVVRASPGELLELRCDPVQIMQVVVNLLVNSIEAMRDQPPATRKIQIHCREAGGEIELLFEDAGPGIPDGDRERVFDPFYTRKEGGLGIGLAVSRRIVHEHAGVIECRPSAGGTAFQLTFPFDRGPGDEV
jgi:PAS domain S-box-containing protein